MHKTYRTILLFGSALLFLLIAPLIVLYAMGFRFNSQKPGSQAVGVLYIESIPSEASVRVNQQEQGQTPRAITNLPPGMLDVVVRKEGYRPWHKQIAIAPNRVSDIRTIRLFPEQPSLTELLSDTQFFSLSPRSATVAAVGSDQTLHLLSTTLVAEQLIIPLPEIPQMIEWSSDASALLLRLKGNRYSILALGGPLPKPYPLSLLHKAPKVQWDPLIPGRLLFLNEHGGLQAYNILNNASVVISESADDFIAAGRYILTEQNQALNLLDLQGRVLKTIPVPSDLAISDLYLTATGKIAFKTAHGQAFVVRRDATLQRILDQVHAMSWSPDEALLLLHVEDASLYVYNDSLRHVDWLKEGQTQLITRLSSPITHAQWFAGSRHLIYEVRDEVKIVEIDTRDVPLTYTLAAANRSNTHVAVGDEGKTVYYLTHAQGKPTLVVADLSL